MKKVTVVKKTQERINAHKFSKFDIVHMNQVSFVNQILLNQEFECKELLVEELRKKLSSYKQQDLSKGIYRENEFIKKDELVEKLVCSRLICHYCGKKLNVIYGDCYDKTQWTLDRVDNEQGHNASNVIVACLGCNLKRRRLDKDKFLFSQRMSIVKLDT
jgi:restriction endonuclease S subunit